MADENNETQPTGSSPVKDSSDSLYSTTDYEESEPEPEPETETDENNTDTEPAGEESEAPEEEPKPDEDNVPFHKHPRFRELIKERNELKEMLEKQNQTQPSEEKQAEGDSTYDKLMNMSDEELLELNTEKPREMLNMMTEAIRNKVTDEVRQEQQKNEIESKTMNTYEQYAEENPDIIDMWESGELKNFLEKNPAHNPISAHMYLTRESRENELREKLEKEIAEKYSNRQTARDNARVLSKTPAADYKQESSPELKDTKSNGGLAAVLTSRLEAMRQKK